MKYINTEELKKGYEGLTEDELMEKIESLTGKMVMTQIQMAQKSTPESEDFFKMADIFAELGYAMTLE